jgi:hypothetical protein
VVRHTKALAYAKEVLVPAAARTQAQLIVAIKHDHDLLLSHLQDPLGVDEPYDAAAFHEDVLV